VGRSASVLKDQRAPGSLMRPTWERTSPTKSSRQSCAEGGGGRIARNLTELKYVTRIDRFRGAKATNPALKVVTWLSEVWLLAAPKSLCVNGQARQIDSRNSAPAAVTATLSKMSMTGATSNSSQVENFAGASARLAGLSVSTTA